ncbi:MAG: hypothetical protein ACTSSN_03970 [Candidatus Heimdallarchaeaceae archaeon]|jgi:hypothetical protein|nr:hypothetical protein [Candidatus Heimdallarchaeota archaeon]MCG3256474.1 hypothetical protein [Candidatus Heimdallarchaeota archaeon]MCK4611539.1 hypothetical protein [Candidatus Heimdallarchaeota archaeon]TET76069.1 MAG: hypothetical protein E3J43_07380 [Candidatus Heimdallarchaeota archaeon]
MVSIIQSLKVSILFFFLGLIPLVVALISFGALLNGGIAELGFIALDASSVAYVWFIGLVVGLLVFFIGLFKAIGDITESALIE